MHQEAWYSSPPVAQPQAGGTEEMHRPVQVAGRGTLAGLSRENLAELA